MTYFPSLNFLDMLKVAELTHCEMHPIKCHVKIVDFPRYNE
jgi:hypothetical protein